MLTANVLAFAKLNLSLAILGRRPDGYHDLDSIVQTIDLADRLCFEVGDGDDIRVENSLRDLRVPDLAHTAAVLLLNAKGARRAIRISIRKAIPAGAGLGGGSSDAAATLRTLDRLIAPRLGEDDLVGLAARIGSDVPLFLRGGRVRMTGRGETVQPLPEVAGEHFVVVVPEVRCPTAEVYATWAPPQARARSSAPALGRNDLLAPALTIRPELRPIADAIARCGAHYGGMSGSGSAFYAAFLDAGRAAAAAADLQSGLSGCDIHLCRATADGSRERARGTFMKIAIDGPAASGKTSVGRALARQFGCRFIETGNMYRAVALGEARGLSLQGIALDVSPDERMLLNGEDVTDLLHTPDLDQASSRVAVRADVRDKLVSLQRALAERSDVVMEGRDIGTVVLPNADVKIFLRASSDVRAQRRAAERGDQDPDATLAELRARDTRDSTRAVAPLNPAEDATIIDTDQKTLPQVISAAADLVKEHLSKRWHGV